MSEAIASADGGQGVVGMTVADASVNAATQTW